MKILAINGSHRADKGYTQFLINKVFSGAGKAGAEYETVLLARHKINRCLGCRQCHRKEHYLECVFHEKDDVEMIFEKMRNAHILIFATPIYIFNMSGLMKMFLDRITSCGDSSIFAISESGLFFHHMDKSLVSKPFLLLTCQDNMEDETSDNVISYFKTFSNFLDAPLAGVIRRKSGVLAGHGTDLEREIKYPKIKIIYNAIETAGFELATFKKVSKKTEKNCNLGIIPIPKFIGFLLKFNFVRKNKRIMNKIFNEAKKHME